MQPSALQPGRAVSISGKDLGRRETDPSIHPPEQVASFLTRFFFLFLFSYQEGDTLHLAVFTDCSDGGPKLKTDRINYAVTSRSSGHVISWGQEQSVTTTTTMMKGDNNGQSTGGLAQLDIR